MHASLSSLAALDDRTKVYCGHEYTVANLRFAHHVEPSSAAIARAAKDAQERREQGGPTVPSTIAHERDTNPFLRVRSPEIRHTLGIAEGADDVTAFAAIRKAKDGFR
jgi:hydroxyacylglutathione hydrolase